MGFCVFENSVVECQPPFIADMCTSHMNLIFGFSANPKFTKGNSLFGPALETSVTAVRPLRNIPFPFEFERDSETGKIITDRTPRLCEEQLSVQWVTFLSEVRATGEGGGGGGNEQDVEKLNVVLKALCKLSTDESATREPSKGLPDWFWQLSSKSARDLLRLRWEESSIEVSYCNRKTNRAESAHLPMVNMPLFYQTLFMHAEMTTPNLFARQDHPQSEVGSGKEVDHTILELNADASELQVIPPNNGGEHIFLRGKSSWKNEASHALKKSIWNLSFIQRKKTMSEVDWVIFYFLLFWEKLVNLLNNMLEISLETGNKR